MITEPHTRLKHFLPPISVSTNTEPLQIAHIPSKPERREWHVLIGVIKCNGYPFPLSAVLSSVLVSHERCEAGVPRMHCVCSMCEHAYAAYARGRGRNEEEACSHACESPVARQPSNGLRCTEQHTYPTKTHPDEFLLHRLRHIILSEHERFRVRCARHASSHENNHAPPDIALHLPPSTRTHQGR